MLTRFANTASLEALGARGVVPVSQITLYRLFERVVSTFSAMR